MWQLYVFSFFAGVFAANAVPHIVKGSVGQKHQTPFGHGSSAVVNVSWGMFNVLVAFAFLHFAHPWPHPYRAFALVAIGATILLLFNARLWASHPERNK